MGASLDLAHFSRSRLSLHPPMEWSLSFSTGAGLGNYLRHSHFGRHSSPRLPLQNCAGSLFVGGSPGYFISRAAPSDNDVAAGITGDSFPRPGELRGVLGELSLRHFGPCTTPCFLG